MASLLHGEFPASPCYDARLLIHFGRLIHWAIERLSGFCNLSGTISYQRGFKEYELSDAALLFDQAFANKHARGIRDRDQRIGLLLTTLDSRYCFSARQGDELVGIIGFRSALGGFTAERSISTLYRNLGLLTALRAALSLSIFEQPQRPGEMTIEGMAIAPNFVNQGIETTLLSMVKKLAAQSGTERILMDIVQGNDRAKQQFEAEGFTVTGPERYDALQRVMGLASLTSLVYTL